MAAGTAAGQEILNAAEVAFEIGGVAQTDVVSNSVRVFVDELLDVTVVSDDSGPVGVGSPDSGRILQFTMTNTGNGDELFRIVADPNIIVGDQFDPTLNQIYLETNGLVGLQIGAGGDDVYVAGSNDPLLAADDVLTIYVESDIPGSLSQNNQGFVDLRSVSVTVVNQSGTDDPASGLWPPVGTQYVGAGDPDTGGGNVTAVVGTSHDLGALLLRAQGTYQVSDAVVTVTKTVMGVTDPFGGNTVVPGAVIDYEVAVSVAGSGTAENVVVTDDISADLAYELNTLTVSALPAGEEADDDFAPIGTDNTGYDAGNSRITVVLGDIVGGDSRTFQIQVSVR